MSLQQLPFGEENFFREKENKSAFFAYSTPVIERNECHKTFGEGSRSVCNTVQVFDVTNAGICFTSRCEEIFNANER